MMETAEVVRQFNPDQTIDVAEKIKSINWLLLTGEGSSRIFPAKNAIRKAHTWGMDINIITEGSSQAMFYDLSKFAVFCASNSGRTKEVVSLTRKQREMGNQNIFGLTANFETMLERTCKETFVLKCGWEKAVAATKSVIEQTLFYESILWNIIRNNSVFEPLGLSMKIEQALTMNINGSIIEDAVKAPIIYFAGYNDGVAEELTLKTNEITRKKSDYLEGTYAVHGIEEVLDKEDIVFLVDPIDEEIEKFQKVLVDGVGLKVVAIAARETPFTTIRVPDAGVMNPYVFLSAGWNLLVEIGLAAGIDLDKPKRARKVGNEFAF
jgi:glutamine---fructose-6-phosphate transaminase (isomerizing)